MVKCPICSKIVKSANINEHIDSNCTNLVEEEEAPTSSSFFKQNGLTLTDKAPQPKRDTFFSANQPVRTAQASFLGDKKRARDEEDNAISFDGSVVNENAESHAHDEITPSAKKHKPNVFEKAAPLAERMRPKTLNDIYGQELVGPQGVLRGLIEQDRIPSMILWGYAGTGKTTIARVMASTVNSRFIEINSTSSGVAECKKLFAEARNELNLTGRKTIIFCDEIHRFSKSQQDIFLGPVEAGHITLIGATTENPSFKVQSALLSRCRTFTLAKLTDKDIAQILVRALQQSVSDYNPNTDLIKDEFLSYLASFSDGDARTALNLLELAMSLSTRPDMTLDRLKASLTKTLVYDRAGDQHYDSISALHKSIRGSNPDGALYYLARMIQSGEDALYIARRMVVMASEDIGLADNSMLGLATATYAACEKIGLPECRINLAHCAVALALAPKSTRAYRGIGNATAVLHEPGVAALPIPLHLRNAPTRLMEDLGYGVEYKYNPKYVDGKCKQEYLPEKLRGRVFLEDRDLGEMIDPDLVDERMGAEEDTVVPDSPGSVDGLHREQEANVGNDETVAEQPLEEQDQEVVGHDDGDEPLSSQTAPPQEWQ